MEDDTQVDQEIYDECGPDSRELGCKRRHPHGEYPKKRDAKIHHKSNKRGSRECREATNRCLTIEHKSTGQAVVDKCRDAEANAACYNDVQLCVHEQHKAARINDGCYSASHSIL
jgi:hypothetical protein